MYLNPLFPCMSDLSDFLNLKCLMKLLQTNLKKEERTEEIKKERKKIW